MRKLNKSSYFTSLELNPKQMPTGTPPRGYGGYLIVTLLDLLSNNGLGKHTLLATIAMVTIQRTLPAILLIKPQQAQKLPISQITVATAMQSHQQRSAQCQTRPNTHTRVKQMRHAS